MSLIASIDYSSTYQNGTQVNGRVYITLTDATTGRPVNGDYVPVSYQVIENGVINNYTVSIPGQSIAIYTGLLTDTNPLNPYYVTFSVTFVGAVPAPAPPVNTCDLLISSVVPIQPESAPGAADGQIRVNATSSYLPILYSTDQLTYQSSNIFTGLAAGLVTVYAKDANNCTAQQSVDVTGLNNLLLADPSVTLIGGNISRWNAAFNPVVFTYQRKDFGVLAVQEHPASGKALVTVNAANTAAIVKGDKVYLKAGAYRGVYETEVTVSPNQLIINTPYNGPATGFININRLRHYYKIITQITYFDKLTGAQSTITASNRPNNEGVTRADLSNFLQSILRPIDDSDYTQSNYRDDNLSASYRVAYAEEWDEGGEAKRSAFICLSHPFYVLYAAKQLGERYGGNLAAYVPFSAVPAGAEKAKWITDFAEPAYSNGYPFDIGFIYSDDLVGRDVFCEITLLDINRRHLPGGPQTSYLLNDDGSWLLNQDGSKLVIARQNQVAIPIPQQLGLNRLLINQYFTADVYYLNITLKYTDEDAVTHTLTETQTVRVDDAVDDQSVYLRWIGLTGCWNYYRFVYNQEVSLDVQNAVIIKNYVFDWENQQGIEEVISKTAGQKIKVVAEDLAVADIKGLQSIKYSPKVQMLVNKNPVKWQTIVINTATYSEYDTRNGQAPFSLTFNLPAINIQTQ
ncbi:hypothetical protein [Mucilaginibacter glaciei]|uniref:Uncharacterized protein n=1 Tax=Mucilaginibacter glaciei TaxID=2772109 RepID=A0A926S2W7_9SPHI|nr:hypothetical protein [Mucilaginibacter glaciei]MBD1394598.1 hypothetical protein [Mucilaginibacter glaciei]